MVDMFLLFLLLLLLLLFSFCLVNGCVMLCRASVVGAVVVVCWICHIVYTLFSLSLCAFLVLSLSASLFFFCTFISHSFDLQRASSVRRDVCAMRMRCAFKIRFFIRQNICLRTYLCGEFLARVLIAIRNATSIIAAVFQIYVYIHIHK